MWPSAVADRTTAWAPCWPARSYARCSTNCWCAVTRSRSDPREVAYPNLTTNMSIYDEMAISLTER